MCGLDKLRGIMLSSWIVAVLVSSSAVLCDVSMPSYDDMRRASNDWDRRQSQQLLPFGTDYLDVRLPAEDDVSSDEISLQTPIVFYDTVYESIYVSDHESGV